MYMPHTEAIVHHPLIESISEYGLYMLNPAGVVASWNPGAERFMGYQASEILGQPLSRFYTAADQEAGLPAAALETAARTGKFEDKGWRVRKDGQQFWAHVVIQPIRDDEGKLVGFAKITRDISERVLFAQNLARSEEQFKRLVEGVTDYALYLLDPQGRVTSWNTGARRIKGYLAEEIVGEDFARFYTPEDRAAGEPQKTLDTAAREGRFETQAWRVRRDGSRFWANVVVDAIRGPNGALIGFAKITRDLAEVKPSAELVVAADVAGREQLEEQLRQSQKMDAIGRVTAGVAHDFNNLLQALGGSLEMMLDAVADRPAAAEWGQVALLAATRGKELTHRLLGLARQEASVARPVLVGVLFRELKELIGHLFDANVQGSIELVMLPGPAGLSVVADLAELEAALINLAVNARDAMAHGGRLCISAHAADADFVPPRRYTVISVADTGGGMDGATLGQACEPFFTTKGADGTGLGLATVQGFARQSGGDMHISSVEGEGTTVELWLPSAGVPAAVEPPVTTVGPDSGRILLVDDSPGSLLVVSAFLRRAGMVVTARSSGDLALGELAGGQRFDVLVTDFAMPGMNGLELLMLAAEIDPSMATLMITGFVDPKALTGFNDVAVLSKPFASAELAEVVLKLVAARRELPPG